MNIGWFHLTIAVIAARSAELQSKIAQTGSASRCRPYRFKGWLKAQPAL